VIVKTVCDIYGSTVGCAKLQHVAHSPNMKFNLCSLSRLIKDGWNSQGNSDMIWVDREEMKLKFGILYDLTKKHRTH
jgi:hypothetical protein